MHFSVTISFSTTSYYFSDSTYLETVITLQEESFHKNINFDEFKLRLL